MGQIGSALVLAAAYYVAAKLGLALAIPPGYATAVWPAAGIALAGVLLRPAAWPGIVLGSFLANLATAASGDPASLFRSGLISISIGSGAAVQAVLGSVLVRRVVGFPNPLTSPRDVGLFYLLGGPVACLFSSAWGVATLMAAGVVPWRVAGFNWWTWWVGDVIGCLTMAPPILVWATQPKGGSLRRPLAVCVPLVLIFACIVVLFLYTSSWERDRLRSDFERRAEGVANRVTNHIDVYLEVLRSIAKLYTSTSVMNGRAFHDFVEYPLASRAGIEALSWDVRVEDARRESFEAAIRAEGYAGFRITEKSAGGGTVTAGRRPEYVAVTYIEPRESNLNAVGYDVASEPTRRATLVRARETGNPAATGRVKLLHETGDQFGFLVFAPALPQASSRASATSTGEPDAYAVGVFRIGNMLERLLTGMETEGLHIELHDESSPPDERLLYRTGAVPDPKAVLFEQRFAVPVAGRDWAIVFRLLPEYMAAHRPWQAWSVLAAGLLFGGLLGAFLLVVTGRTIEIEQLVHTRTAELEGANERLAAEALERGRAQRELERVMNSVSDTLWAAEVTPAGDYSYLYCSPNVEVLTGRPTEFFLHGRDRWLSLVAPEDRDRVREMTNRLVSGISEHEEAEYRIVLPDGGTRWLRDSMTASRATFAPVRLSGVLADITDAKAIERQSLERETQAAEAKRDERFRSLIENASDVVLVLDAGSTILYASPSVEAILGYRADDLIRRPIVDLVVPDDREGLQSQLQAVAARNGASGAISGRIRDKGGTLRVVEGTARNLSHKPAVGGIVVNCRDVTEQDRLEAQLRQAQKMEAIGQLAGGVAHDFNNLLGVITGYGDLLMKDMGSEHPWSKRLVQIQKAAERASDLTRQLLAFSRKQLLRLEVLDLNVVVSDVAKMLRRLIGEDIQLVTILAPQLGRVRADPAQIEQVIMNLALNARDAMPTGGRLVIEAADAVLDEAFVESHAGASLGPHVVLTVTDTGHGMDDSTLSHIFEPFFTTKREGQGTGLGLATVYGIVQQSEGYLDVSSSPGFGTTFRVYLPCLREADTETLSEQAAEPGLPPGGSETVLLVEDDPALRCLVREILSDAGYQVLEAAEPEQAIELGRTHPGGLDVLLTDVIMPRMSGREVAEAICAGRPGTIVVYMSGYTDDVLGRHALDPGTHLLEKPFSASSVLHKLRAVLEGQRG